MEIMTVVSSGITIAVVSGAVGKVLGSRGKVREDICGERRESCVALIVQKIDHLTSEVGHLTEYVKNGRGVSKTSGSSS